MAPNTPTSEDSSKTDIRKADISKIHAEINQLVNQRFLLTLVAVSFFGVVSVWLIPKSPPSAGDAIGHFVFATTILLLVILFVWLSSRLLRITLILAGYVRRPTLIVSMAWVSHA